MNAAAAISAAIFTALTAAPAIAERVAKGDVAALPLNLDTGIVIRATGMQLEPDLAHAGAMNGIPITIELRKRGPNDEDAATALDALLTAAHGRLAANPSLGLSGVRLVADDDFADFETNSGGEVFIHSVSLRYIAQASINLSTLELE